MSEHRQIDRDPSAAGVGARARTFVASHPFGVSVCVATFLIVLMITISLLAAHHGNVALARIQELDNILMKVDALILRVIDLETAALAFARSGERADMQAVAASRERLETEARDINRSLVSLNRIFASSGDEPVELVDTSPLDRSEAAPGTPPIERRVMLWQAGDLHRRTTGLKHELRTAIVREQGRVQQMLEHYNVMTMLGTLVTGALAAVSVMLFGRYARSNRQESLLRMKEEQARAEAREKSTFLAHISHEIRTPMNTLLGFGRLLSERLSDPVNKRYIDAITGSGHELLALVNDVLDLSRIEAGRVVLKHDAVNLKKLTESVVRAQSRWAAERGLTLAYRVDPALPDAVWLDPVRTRQLLTNLVTNAIKCTESGGRVDIGLSGRVMASGELQLVLAVKDTGIGIPPADRQKIFEPYFQSRYAGPDAKSGSGLGLAIIREVGALMDAEIELETAVGEGSTFRIIVPDVRAVPATGERAPSSTASIDAIGPQTILVVDDADANRQLLLDMMRKTHHRVISARSGHAGLKCACVEHPDLVLLDVHMRDMNGLEMARRIRASLSGKRTRMIAVTASESVSKDGIAQQGLDGLVKKPFTESELFDEILRVFDSDGGEQPAAAVDERTRAEIRARLPASVDGLTIREMRAFIAELSGMAERRGGAWLAAQAESLTVAAESFDFVRAEKLITRLGRQVGHPA